MMALSPSPDVQTLLSILLQFSAGWVLLMQPQYWAQIPYWHPANVTGAPASEDQNKVDQLLHWGSGKWTVDGDQRE